MVFNTSCVPISVITPNITSMILWNISRFRLSKQNSIRSILRVRNANTTDDGVFECRLRPKIESRRHRVKKVKMFSWSLIYDTMPCFNDIYSDYKLSYIKNLSHCRLLRLEKDLPGQIHQCKNNQWGRTRHFWNICFLWIKWNRERYQ